MASSNWTTLTNSQATSIVDRGVTSGVATPNGGGSFTYGFNSLDLTAGAAGLFGNQTNFAPMAKGGSVRAAIKRAPSGGPDDFAPFLFCALQGPDVNDNAYMLGLSEGDPFRIILKKGTLVSGMPDLAPDPANNGVLLRSSDSFDVDEWLHLRLDVILQGTGDVLLRVFRSDLAVVDVTAPAWNAIPGMEGPLAPTVEGFVDDALQVNTGSAPLVGGRAGFGFQSAAVSRRAFFDHLELARQL